MAITLGGASTDKISHGTDASVDNLQAFSMLLWLRCTTTTNSRRLWTKGTQKSLAFTGNAGRLQLTITRTSSLTYTGASSAAGELPTTTWQCVATCFDAAQTPAAHIYIGGLTTTLTELSYSTQSDGSGAATNDASNPLVVGNITGGSGAFQGDVALALFWGRMLPLAELRSLQFDPRPTSGCLLYSVYGWNGLGTQPDWSGHSQNAGTVTGGAVAPAHVPLAAPFGMSLPMPYAIRAVSNVPLVRARERRLFVPYLGR